MRVVVAVAAVLVTAGAVRAASAEDKQPVPEVTVTAKLAELRAQIITLEDQFYAEYNRLNTDHQFDMRCAQEARTGSQLESRQCRPVFVERAQSDYAKKLVDDLQTKGGLATSPPPAASTFIMNKWSAFEKNMLNSIRRYPELRKLINERDAAEKRYRELRKKE